MARPRRPPFAVPRLESVLLVALALVGIGLWTYRSRKTPPPTESGGAPLTSLAVLPFENVTGDPEQEFFSQGVSDEIRTALGRIPGLRVASRTSSFHFAAGTRSIQEIAGELGVDAVLEGSVQRANDRVRVSVSLVDAASDRQLWSEVFDRQLDVETLFQVEEEIAASVAAALQVGLGTGIESLAGPAPVSIAVHDLYLLGLYHWNRRTGDELLRAVDFFLEASARDPSYALAQAGLANTYVLLPLYADVPASEAMSLARAAADRALALDSTLAEAHAALAFVRTAYDWNWSAAGESFARALALDPDYATAHEWYGIYLDALGRFDEARVQHERAHALDPLSAIINEAFANHFIYSGSYEQAVTQLLRTLELQPDLPLALQFLAETYLLAGRPADARQTLARLAEVTGTDPEPWNRVVTGIESRGARPAALAALREMADAGSLSPYRQAQYYALLGADDEALSALEQGLEEKDWLMFLVNVDPAFANLAPAERFRLLLARLGLQPQN